MTQSRGFAPLLSIALLLCLCGTVAAAQGIQVPLGDTVPLSGYASGSNWVYLFLTGPNLPANGVMLNDVTKRADQGYFTKVQLDGNDHWSYKWSTANVGGRLDEGTYTIWVVNGPNDLSHLSEADYGTISVTLQKPALAVDTIQPAGSMAIESVPPGATVLVNDIRRGSTPLTLPDLAPGTYLVTFTLDGYAPFTTPVSVATGRVSEVEATLVPLTETATVMPATPQITATVFPKTTPAPTQRSPGFLLALALGGAILAWEIRRHG